MFDTKSAVSKALAENEAAVHDFVAWDRAQVYGEGVGDCPVDTDATQKKIATAQAKNINDAILKLEYGVDMMHEFTVLDEMGQEWFDIIKAALSDFRRLSN